MTHPPMTYPKANALDNRLIRLEFSTATWIMIAAVLHERKPVDATISNRRWAADHILFSLLEAHGYAEPSER